MSEAKNWRQATLPVTFTEFEVYYASGSGLFGNAAADNKLAGELFEGVAGACRLPGCVSGETT